MPVGHQRVLLEQLAAQPVVGGGELRVHPGLLGHGAVGHVHVVAEVGAGGEGLGAHPAADDGHVHVQGRVTLVPLRLHAPVVTWQVLLVGTRVRVGWQCGIEGPRIRVHAEWYPVGLGLLPPARFHRFHGDHVSLGDRLRVQASS